MGSIDNYKVTVPEKKMKEQTSYNQKNRVNFPQEELSN
jgi:hypothetical protein